MPVKVMIYREPCWLLEAAELVYSLVNEIPVEKMTSNGSYCIPAGELAYIRKTACASIDPADRQVRLYFKGVPLEGIPERMSCLGNCILHQFLELSCPEPEDMVRQLASDWNEALEAGVYFNTVGPFSLGFKRDPEHRFETLAESIELLPLPQAYQMRLVEVYSNYEAHLRQVYQMLLPVTEMLKELLDPWVRRAAPLLDQWEDFFQHNSPQEFLRQRGRAVVDRFDTLELTICFFYPNLCPNSTIGDRRTIRCMMGVSKVPSINMTVPQCPEEWELSALRLVMNPARLSMLRAMRDKPMAVQEVSKQLNLNVGAVSRDINTMRNARLLLADDSSSRRYYSTNLAEIEKIASHVLDWLKNS